MKKGLKIATIVIIGLLLILITLPFAFKGKIETLVKQEGNKLLKAEFDFKKLDISLLRNFPRATVSLKEFWIKGINEFENDTLLKSNELSATINLLSLLKNEEIDIHSVLIDETTVKALVTKEDKVNWDILKDEVEDAEDSENLETSSDFKVKLKKVTIKKSNLSYRDDKQGLFAEVKNLNAQLSGDLSSNHTVLDVSASTPALTYQLGSIPFLNKVELETDLAIDADLKTNRFTLSKNKIRLNAIQTNLDGWVQLNEESTDLDLKFNTEDVGFKEILSLIPAIYTTDFKELKAEGKASLSAHAKGSLKENIVPQFEATIQVKDANFKYPDLPMGVDNINVLATIQNPGGDPDKTVIKVNPFTFKIAQNPFSLLASITHPVSDPFFHIATKGVLNLAMIEKVYPLDKMQLNGVIDSDVEIKGKQSFIEKELYENISASGKVRVKDMILGLDSMPQIEIKESLLTFTPKDLKLSETTIFIGKNDLTLDSKLENYIGYIVSGKPIKGFMNIKSNFFNLNDVLNATDEEEQSTANSDSISTLIEIPKNIDFQLQASMKEVKLDQMVFNDLHGGVLISGGNLTMNNLEMLTMGGTVLANATYSPQSSELAHLNGSFTLKELKFADTYNSLEMVQSLAPIFKNLQGNFSGLLKIETALNKEMSPIMESMSGSGSIQTRGLKLGEMKIINQVADAVKRPDLIKKKVKDLDLDFKIDKGRLYTDPFDLKLGEYELNLTGSTGIDQSIDYRGKVKLPETSGDLAKLTTIDLKIEGTFDSPKLSLDMKSMATQAAKEVTKNAVNKLSKELGLTNDSTGGEIDIDSISTDLKEKGKKKALDFLKKTIKK